MANFPLTSPEDLQDVETNNAHAALLSQGLEPEDAFRRQASGEHVPAFGPSLLVIINFASRTAQLPLPLETKDQDALAQPVFATHPGTDTGLLRPWEVRVIPSP